jgi:hypothetical protein
MYGKCFSIFVQYTNSWTCIQIGYRKIWICIYRVIWKTETLSSAYYVGENIVLIVSRRSRDGKFATTVVIKTSRQAAWTQKRAIAREHTCERRYLMAFVIKPICFFIQRTTIRQLALLLFLFLIYFFLLSSQINRVQRSVPTAAGLPSNVPSTICSKAARIARGRRRPVHRPVLVPPLLYLPGPPGELTTAVEHMLLGSRFSNDDDHTPQFLNF